MRTDQERRDKRLVDRFVKEAAAMLTERRLVRDGLSINFRFDDERGVGGTFTASEHDWEDVLAYLPSLRRFLLATDDLHVEKIRTAIRRHVTEARLVSDVDEIGGQWESRKSAAPITVLIDSEDGTSTSLDSWDVFDLYLNGTGVHIDLAKAEKLDQLLADTPAPLVQSIVLDGAVEATEYVAFLVNTVKFATAHGHWSDEIVHQDP